MIISTKGRYGLRALLDLAANCQNGPVALSSIAKRQQISEGYLEQLMMPMKKNGLVISMRGAKGGYVLARPAEEILVKEVYDILEGPVLITACVGHDHIKCVMEDTCATKSLWNEIQDKVNEILLSYTLADLLDGKNLKY
ncbi:MAG: Rrf2 family transcriptional regulator [Clostridiales bacterium]